MVIRTLIKTILLTSIAIFAISLTVIPVSIASDDSNRYRDDSSSVFAPGYLNAAKYQAEAIMNQQTPKKSLLENAIEYVQNAMASKVEKTMSEKAQVTPKLQQKQGTPKGKSNNQEALAAAAWAAANAATPGTIPAYIENSVQEYLNRVYIDPENPRGPPDYQIKSANGKYYVLWCAQINDIHYPIKLQIFDSSGNTILASPATIHGSEEYYDTGFDVTTLSNGNIALFWGGANSDYSNYSSSFQILDSNGNELISSPTAITNSSTRSIVSLANGNAALFWADLSDNSIKFQTLDQSGILLASPNTLTGSEDLLGTSMVGVITLSNGNSVLCWNEFDSNDNSYVKFQTLSSSGNLIASPNTNIASGFLDGTIDIKTLANGSSIIFWSEEVGLGYNDRSTKFQILDSSGNLLTAPVTLTSTSLASEINAASLINGNIAFLWSDDGGASVNFRIFDSGGNMVSSPVTIRDVGTNDNITSMLTLSNGNIALFWTEVNWDDYSNILEGFSSPIKYQILDSNGNPLTSAATLNGAVLNIASIHGVATLANGDTAIFWNEKDGNGHISLQSKAIDSSGNFTSSDVLKPPSFSTSLIGLGNAIIYNPNINPFSLDFLIDSSSYNTSQTNTYAAGNDVSGIFKALLADKGILGVNLGGAANPQIAEKIGKDSLKESAMAIPVSKYISAEDVEIAMKLSSILKNPTEDQKVILDAIKALLSQTDKIKEGKANKGASEELTKAENDLLNAVANILLAQAMPDLLKSGDMSNIKGIFQELDTQKKAILLEYAKSTKPYYDNMLKDLARNMAILQLKNILNSNMSKEQIEKLPPSELDKILDKIKKQEKKAFEEEYILQQEAKYRKTYLDPGKQKLEEDMKHMLKDFTGKINNVLKSSEKK